MVRIRSHRRRSPHGQSKTVGVNEHSRETPAEAAHRRNKEIAYAVAMRDSQNNKEDEDTV